MGHDVRDAVRALLRSPLSSALIVIALGLGIGVNTAIFSLVDVILVRILASQEGGFARRPHDRAAQRVAAHQGPL